MTPLVWAVVFGSALAGPAEHYAAGTAATRSGDPVAAAASFVQTLEAGGRSADTYHALGNALYRQGASAHALAAWQRGLRLDPRNPDLAANRDRARQGAPDALEPPVLQSPWVPWSGLLSPAEGAWLAGVLAFLAGVGLLVTKARSAAGRSGSRTGALGVLGGAGVVALATLLQAQAPHSVVVVVPEVTVRSALGPAGIDLFALHDRSEVLVLEDAGEHLLVTLPDDRKGWLSRQAVVSTDPEAPFPLPSLP